MRQVIFFYALILTSFSCKMNKSVSPHSSESDVKVIDVNPDYFIRENFIDGISVETVDIKGEAIECFVLKTHSMATEHQMGPWCPDHIEDGKDKGGIWFEDGKVYDVTGHFISELAEFYKDDTWKLYNDDGSIKVTDSKEACMGAAKPRVEPQYQNHCVECLPAYFKDQVTTFYIPITPRYQASPQRFGRGGLGIALNGVKYLSLIHI